MTEKKTESRMEVRWMGVKQVMEYLSIGRNLALALIHQSGTEVRIGRRLLVEKKDFDLWLDQGIWGRGDQK